MGVPIPKLTLSAPLFALVPDEVRTSTPYRRSVEIEARSWPSVATELRERFPALADRVLTDDGGVAHGFVLVVNDEVLPRRIPPFELGDEDEVCLIAAIAGGAR
jgi:sulfur carrier protein ThiS